MYLIRKVVEKAVAPLSLSLLTLLAVIFLARRRPRLCQSLAMVSLLVVLPLSIPVCAKRIIQPLELFAPPSRLESLADSEAIVVLGGTVPPNPEQLSPPEEISGSRVRTAAALFQLGKAPTLLASSGISYKTYPSGSLRTEAEDIADILVSSGVPRASILVENRAQNTLENALYSAILLKERGIKNILLVTSAYHLQRATRLFEQTGLNVHPVPSGRWIRKAEPTLLDFFPSAHCLSRSTSALKEYAGMLFEKPMERHIEWKKLGKEK